MWHAHAFRRIQAPYPYPATHDDGTAPDYAVKNEKDGIVEGKINVHLVPHTHDVRACLPAASPSMLFGPLSILPPPLYLRGSAECSRGRLRSDAGYMTRAI